MAGMQMLEASVHGACSRFAVQHLKTADLYSSTVRLVLDTSVVASAFRSPHGASRVLVRAFDENLFIWLLSNALLTEYEAVLTRPEQRKVHGVSLAGIHEFLDNLVQRAVRVSFDRRLRPQLRDPNDELVLETAVNGVADAIVTHNLRDFGPATSRFDIAVLTPGLLLKDKIRL